MKLNIGSGIPRGIYLNPEWICLDLNYISGLTVVGDGTYLPFANNIFEEIHSIHVLEHLTRDKWPLMLAEIFRVLDIGGSLFLEVPDFEEQCRKYLKRLQLGDTERLHLIRTGIWGKTERSGMAHHFGFDKNLLKRVLNKIGFKIIEQIIDVNSMISLHYRFDPILLFKATKTGYLSTSNIYNLSFEELNKNFLR